MMEDKAGMAFGKLAKQEKNVADTLVLSLFSKCSMFSYECFTLTTIQQVMNITNGTSFGMNHGIHFFGDLHVQVWLTKF